MEFATCLCRQGTTSRGACVEEPKYPCARSALAEGNSLPEPQRMQSAGSPKQWPPLGLAWRQRERTLREHQGSPAALWGVTGLARLARLVGDRRHFVALSSTLSRDTTLSSWSHKTLESNMSDGLFHRPRRPPRAPQFGRHAPRTIPRRASGGAYRPSSRAHPRRRPPRAIGSPAPQPRQRASGSEPCAASAGRQPAAAGAAGWGWVTGSRRSSGGTAADNYFVPKTR